MAGDICARINHAGAAPSFRREGWFLPLWLEQSTEGPGMASQSSVVAHAKRGVRYAVSRLRQGPEADKASAYWGSLADYHITNDDDPIAIRRSQWLAETIIPPLHLTSLLEIGTNSGRNLRYIHQSHPDMKLKGIDVNARAIEYRSPSSLQ